MSVPPLYTDAELAAEIAAFKAAARALATAQSYTLEINEERRQLTRVDLPAIREHLKYLQGERIALAQGTSGCGLQAFAGRVRRW